MQPFSAKKSGDYGGSVPNKKRHEPSRKPKQHDQHRTKHSLCVGAQQREETQHKHKTAILDIQSQCDTKVARARYACASCWRARSNAKNCSDAIISRLCSLDEGVNECVVSDASNSSELYGNVV